jgi:hypothetical protein
MSLLTLGLIGSIVVWVVTFIVKQQRRATRR